jgi:hypothetical protein
MKISRLAATVCVAFALAGVLVRAHPMTYQGTVIAVESTRVQVKTVDPMTKKEAAIWFVVTKDTKVKRGDKTVTYAEAKIAKDERIVITVDMDAETKNLAEEIRLGVK